MNPKPIKIKVSLNSRTYPISIGQELTKNLTPLLRSLSSRDAFIVSDKSLRDIRLEVIRSLKRSSWNVTEIPVEAGEGLKDFKKVYEIYGQLLKKGARRDSVLFALGGGSVGDAAGFVASTYLRGIPWVGVPTTLLAQVDSSVGGKTAINHRQGKNLIGTFYQPSTVICDVSFLETLSQREVISGLGEALKYGLVYDPAFFKFIMLNWQQILKCDLKVLTTVVQKSLLWKSRVISRDEFDKKGERELLNFGHTFGHALEKMTNFKVFQHGEAVIWGMRFALSLSFTRKFISKTKYQETDSCLALIPLPPLPKNLSVQKVLKLISKDKKVRRGRLHFVLLRGMGHPISDANVSEKDISDALMLLRAKP